MSQGRTPTASTKATIAELAKPRTVDTVNPIAARFVYSLRLIALHQRAKPHLRTHESPAPGNNLAAQKGFPFKARLGERFQSYLPLKFPVENKG